MLCMILFNYVNYVCLLLRVCILIVMYVVFCVFCFIVFSAYCLCVNVYCTTATGCQPNCSYQIYHILRPLNCRFHTVDFSETLQRSTILHRCVNQRTSAFIIIAEVTSNLAKFLTVSKFVK
jgi:hypothetical protein